MSEIDRQNAKQIRDPMDVLITMDLEDSEITMSYSGYSSAKVADGALNKRNWPMRGLADLQGEGFPLDGSRVLYNPSTYPSYSNGKLGVRSNIGQPVSVAATGDKVMASLTINVTGAESVTYNGTTTEIRGSSVTIPGLSTSISMEFTPASETKRIEISDIFPDSEFRITNDNLIKATVSLRSDLSLFDQKLPESEINIEVYHDVDISEAVATIPADTPIIYQAGYPGDMSPKRKFYVSGQVTWADNVLTIHAVDAVHFLDWNVEPAILIRYTWAWMALTSGFLGDIEHSKSDFMTDYDIDAQIIVKEGQTARQIIAAFNWLLNIQSATPTGENYNIYFKYVDAGIPKIMQCNDISWGAEWSILEEDCADVKSQLDVPLRSITVRSEELNRLFDPNQTSRTILGTGTWVKDIGVSLSFDKYCDGFIYGVDEDSEYSQKLLNYYGQLGYSYCAIDVGPAETDGSGWGTPYDVGSYSLLFTPGLSAEGYNRMTGGGLIVPYVAFVPWNARYNSDTALIGTRRVTSMDQAWKAYTDANAFEDTAQSVDLVICGNGYDAYNTSIKYESGASEGQDIEVDSPFIGKGGTLFPTRVFNSLFDRSNKGGSFKWKGDPRMQPRDVVEWENLDGTTTTITLENITLTHEGGGTMAEITYREGVI